MLSMINDSAQPALAPAAEADFPPIGSTITVCSQWSEQRRRLRKVLSGFQHMLRKTARSSNHPHLPVAVQKSDL